MKVPSNMGRIPNKIASSFGSFTSEQWKLWTVVYSEFALKNYLPTEDYKLWLLFVKACRILTAPVITIKSLSEAHSSLMQFCKKFESMYGQLEVTPNMHQKYPTKPLHKISAPQAHVFLAGKFLIV